MGPIRPQASNSTCEWGPASTYVCEPQLLQNTFRIFPRISETCLTYTLEQSQATTLWVPESVSSSHTSSPLPKNSNPEPMGKEWGNKLKEQTPHLLKLAPPNQPPRPPGGVSFIQNFSPSGQCPFRLRPANWLLMSRASPRQQTTFSD